MAVAAASLSSACLNDRDSLFMETMQQKDVLKAVVGWFPVHTPLYYQLRIQLACAEIKLHPERLSLYDDVAVAYDHLNDDVHAIETIDQKRDYMLAHGIKEHEITIHGEYAPSKEQIAHTSEDPWYRYYANAGTFWVHRWFHEGMPKEHKKEWLDRAQHDIDRGIEINPYAHGLREFAQAEAIRWIRQGKPGQTFFAFKDTDFWRGPEATSALAGLVELGGAWESVDVFHALSQALLLNHSPRLAYLAFQRVVELQKGNKRSATGKVFEWQESTHDSDRLDADFARLRSGAESYRKDLATYETPLLQQGRHPDTDPNFWANYKEPPFPSYGFLPWYTNSFTVVMGVLLSSMGIVIVLIVGKWIRDLARLYRRPA